MCVSTWESALIDIRAEAISYNQNYIMEYKLYRLSVTTLPGDNNVPHVLGISVSEKKKQKRENKVKVAVKQEDEGAGAAGKDAQMQELQALLKKKKVELAAQKSGSESEKGTKG